MQLPSLPTIWWEVLSIICPFPRELVDAAIRLVAVPSLSSAFVALDFSLAGKIGRSSNSILDGKFRKLYTLLTCFFYIQALQACVLCLLLYTALRTVILTLKPFRLLFCYSYFSMWFPFYNKNVRARQLKNQCEVQNHSQALSPWTWINLHPMRRLSSVSQDI